jgi:DNA (cytosine-5)-methyltransferase 1
MVVRMGCPEWTVIDFFSGAGGMSCGFHLHPAFEVIRSVDAQIGKPSSGRGSLKCNSTYKLNIGIDPIDLDLSRVEVKQLRRLLGLPPGFSPDVFIACPPCTGFSRANPENHLRDDSRNSLVARCAEFALELQPEILLMENARELLQGNFRHHFARFRERVEAGGYRVFAANHMLTRFGLPRVRERALVIAVREPLHLRTLEDLWEGHEVDRSATTVRRAIGEADFRGDPAHVFPGIKDPVVVERLRAIPSDGGSWIDLARDPRTRRLLTPSMESNLRAGRTGSYPDVYGRMAWDKPAPTIKRECGHIGNGRYAHPEEDRLCSVREMAVLNGFPVDYQFNGAGMSNLYRHIGDAVPPVISHQLAHVCEWILTGLRPDLESCLMPRYHLNKSDLAPTLLGV